MKITTFTTNVMSSHMYIIKENNRAIVVDPADSDSIINFIENNNLALDAILLTHEHCDHSFGVTALKEHFNVKVYASINCNKNLSNTRKNYSRYFSVFSEIQTKFYTDPNCEIEPFTCEADITFYDEMSFIWEGHIVLLKETPGHSEGSICILVDNSIMFSGDTLLWNEKTVTKFLGGASSKMISITIPWFQSLNEDIYVYPGHLESFKLSDRLQKDIII